MGLLTTMTFLILHLLGNSVALFIAARYIQGVSFSGTFIDLLIAGLVLGILNFFIKPILKILSAPLIILTLGLFIFIINLFILWLLKVFVPALSIQGFFAYLWTLLLLTAINFLINHYHQEE